MKVYVGRKLDGNYEIYAENKFSKTKWDKRYGFRAFSRAISCCSEYFHRATSLRLRKGQMRTFDRVEFK